MIIGMGTAARGSDVRRLQDVLTSQGHAIDSAERDAQEFGPSTLAALQAFQARYGLGPTDKVDAATLEMLLRLERNLTGNGTAIPTNPPATDSSGGVVQGRLVDADGAPVAGMAITLVSKQVRTETPLGNTTTDKTGQYTIAYARKSALNLMVRPLTY